MMSTAVERNYDNFDTARPEDNDLFSLFRYTELEGLDYNNFDGAITRRDPYPLVYKRKIYLYYKSDFDLKERRSRMQGRCHNIKAGVKIGRATVLMRFDCDLSLDFHDPEMKKNRHFFSPDVNYKAALSRAQRERVMQATKELMTGESLVPMLKDPAMETGRMVVTTHGYKNHAVRSDHWRCIRYADGSEELCDQLKDPKNFTNLLARRSPQGEGEASNPELADIKRKLAASLPRTDADSHPAGKAPAESRTEKKKHRRVKE